MTAFHSRPLMEAYRYLIVDGLYVTIRDRAKGKKQAVANSAEFELCATGLTRQLHREWLDFLVVESESEAAWTRFLTDLSPRGVTDDNLKVVVSDGSAGLANAVEMVYPRTRHQRCWVHKLRNVHGYLKSSQREACLAEAKGLYQAKDLREAQKRFALWKVHWKETAPQAVHCRERDLDRLFEFYRHPEDHRKAIRTTNTLERSFREVRQRTDVIGAFNNERSFERIACLVLSDLNQRWRRPAIRRRKK